MDNEDYEDYFCAQCEQTTTFEFIPEEIGDRFQPGWDACYQCTECQEHQLEMDEVRYE
jgi:hypothetical protein